MNKTHRPLMFNWLLLLIYCLIIFYLSAKPGPSVFPKIKHGDKILHFAAFAVMGFLCFRAFWSLKIKRTFLRIFILSLVFSTVFGIGIEVNQLFIPYRTAETLDIVADVLGSIIGILMTVLPYKKRAKGLP